MSSVLGDQKQAVGLPGPCGQLAVTGSWLLLLMLFRFIVIKTER